MYIEGGNCGEVERGGATSGEGGQQEGAADRAFPFQALSESTHRKVLHFCADEMMEALSRATETAEKSEAIALQLREQVRSKAQMLLIDLKAVEVSFKSLSFAEKLFSTDENLGHEDLELSCSTDQKTTVDVFCGSKDGCEASAISRSRLGSMTATCSYSALSSAELGREHHLQDDSNSCKGHARLQSKVSKGSATLCSAVNAGHAHPTAKLKLVLDMRAAGQQGSLRRAAFNINLATDLANVCIVNASVIVLCEACVFVCLFACVRAQG